MPRRELKKRIRKYEKQQEKKSTFEPRPAHRLDIDTSGIVVIALTPTALPGVFAAGDVVDTRYKQAITAEGMGCSAAIDVEKWLEDNVH